MGLIKVLDPITANQIAAGEVVERPASVVKELVENSLDAQASSIEVTITDGGTKSIIVKDNGVGIYPEDMVIAFERHATSKITTAQDLNNLLSLGFRGEALPSIASVSKVDLISRPREITAGQKVSIHGGNLAGIEDIGCAPGTTIQVKELFYNTPARKKHLKSAAAEASQITDVLTRLALAHPQVSFKLSSNGRSVLASPGTGNLRDTIINLYGQEIGQELVSVEGGSELVKVKGFVVRPVVTRNNRHMQTIIVNGRYVRSRFISQAVLAAYHTLLPVGRHPVFVLDLQLDPGQVDANVHPTKMEIRFEREQEILELVRNVVNSALEHTNLVPGIQLPRPSLATPRPASTGATPVKVEQKSIEWFNQTKPVEEPMLSLKKTVQMDDIEPWKETEPKPQIKSADEVKPVFGDESKIQKEFTSQVESKVRPLSGDEELSELAESFGQVKVVEEIKAVEKMEPVRLRESEPDEVLTCAEEDPQWNTVATSTDVSGEVEGVPEVSPEQECSGPKGEIMESEVNSWIAQLLPIG